MKLLTVSWKLFVPKCYRKMKDFSECLCLYLGATKFLPRFHPEDLNHIAHFSVIKRSQSLSVVLLLRWSQWCNRDILACKPGFDSQVSLKVLLVFPISNFSLTTRILEAGGVTTPCLGKHAKPLVLLQISLRSRRVAVPSEFMTRPDGQYPLFLDFWKLAAMAKIDTHPISTRLVIFKSAYDKPSAGDLAVIQLTGIFLQVCIFRALVDFTAK